MAVRHISAAAAAALESEDLRAALEFVYEISAVGDPDEFADRTMRGLAELVRCDYVSYVETNPVAGRATALTEPREAIVPDAAEALARNLGEHPLVRYYAETGELRALKMSDFVSQRQFHRLQLYDELFGPAETNYLLSAVLPVSAGLVVGFSLHRRSSDFSERDRSLVDLVQPHLAQAYERSLLRSAVGALEDAAEQGDPGLVGLGLDGSVLWVSPEAEQALRRHFELPAMSHRLPDAVANWLSAGCSGPLVTSVDGRRLRIDSLGGRPAALLVTERAVRPSAEGLGRLGLSKREAQVLALVAQGMTNAEIARLLSVSPGTVKRHLEHVYAKLGVHRRTEAAAAAWAAD